MALKNKNRKTLIQVIIFLGLGLALIYWQYTSMNAGDLKKMQDSITAVNWWWLIPIVIVGFLSHYYRALRWRVLLAPLDIHPGKTNTILAVLIGYLTNSLIPRAGEIAKCTVLAKYEGAAAEKLIGTIVAERAFDLLCLLLLAGITLLVQYEVIYPYVQELFDLITQKLFTTETGNIAWGKYVLLGIGVLVISIVVILIFKGSRKSKAGNIMAGIGAGLKAIGHIQQKTRFFAYTFGIWFCYTFILNMAFWAMPALSEVPLLASLSIVVFGSVAMIVTPGGIGAYPPVVAGILWAYGISFPEGNAFGWLSWMVQTGMILSMGMAAVIILPIYNRKKNEQQIKTIEPKDSKQPHVDSTL